MKHRGGERLASEVNQILTEHGYTRVCHPLEDAARAIGRTDANITGKVFLYKWSGMIILVSVPVISTVLSILMSERSRPSIPAAAKYLSYAVTLLTLLNSIFKPKERFKEICAMGIKVQNLRDAFLGEIEMLPPAIEEERLHALAAAFRLELAPFEERLISLFLPETAVEISGRSKTMVAKGLKPPAKLLAETAVAASGNGKPTSNKGSKTVGRPRKNAVEVTNRSVA